MSCRGAPSVLLLRKQFDELYPARDRSSDGICGDAAHQLRKSDHNPDSDGLVTAVDIDEDVVSGWNDRELWEVAIRLLADPRTKYIIYEGRILYPDGRNDAYHGINAHKHHMHVSIKGGAARFDLRPWDIIDVRKLPSFTGKWEPLPSPVPLVPIPVFEEDDVAVRTFQPNGKGPEQVIVNGRRVSLTANDKDFLEELGLVQKDKPPIPIHPEVADYLFGTTISRPANLP